MAANTKAMFVLLALLALLAPDIQAFSWRTKAVEPSEIGVKPLDHQVQSSFSLALEELEELESSPFCHRVAARLLVNNCKLIDGKDEATILMDSGRKIRDFVDSYAASLAICDLERGSFMIPRECAQLQEGALTKIEIRKEPRLHLTTEEILSCLSALATSDAAWGTWVSYRHKALRFCEAARGDNEKAQNILLYQKLTKVLAKLSDGVESELNKRMDELNKKTRQAFDDLEMLSPQIGQLKDRLAGMETYLSNDLDQTLRRSSESARNGLEEAETLQRLINMLLKRAVEGNAELASAHELSVRKASVMASDEIGAMAAIVATAAASSAALQEQIKLSNGHAEELARRQDTLEQSLDHIISTTQSLVNNQKFHSEMIKHATNITNDLLDTLEVTAQTATVVNKSFFEGKSGGWLPFIICPIVTIIAGSYGLEPSVIRNLGLLALGELTALYISTGPTVNIRYVADVFRSTANATAI
ncbi:hypothetical protein OQA88_9024 [Cercophora sp. LCS_1]